MQQLQEAKKRLILNVGSNILFIGVTTAINIWLTPYLIKNLGLAVYGMIPLIISLASYFDLISISLSSTVVRFTTIHLGRNELEQSNIYFNTALFSIMLLCTLITIPLTICSAFIIQLFNIPQGYENESVLLFVLIIGSSVITVIASPFQVSTFATHRFDLDNSRKIFSKLVQVAVIVICFNYFSKSLRYIGLSYLLMAALLLILLILLKNKLTPMLRVNCKAFRLWAMREMMGMGSWILLDQIGFLLYLSVNLMVINLLLGPVKVGLYGPFVQIASLFAMLGAAIVGVFNPVAYQYIAQQQIDILSAKALQAMKYTAIVIALPVGLCCGLSAPLLRLWLGEPFAVWSLLMWLLVGVNIFNIIVNPITGINRGLNRVRWPAIVTFIGGVLNLVLSIILVRYTRLDLYGVALAVCICLLAKHFFFLPIYTASLLGKPKLFFFKPLLLGGVCCSVVGLSSLSLSNILIIDSVMLLIIVCISMAVIYLTVAYALLLNNDDRGFIWSLFRTKILNV
jgi:membrane protein EpsK